MLQRTREIERAITRSLGRKRTLRLLLMVGGILVVLVAALTFWLRGGRYVSADDAYVRAAKLMVSTDVSGIVTEVDVREGQTVKAGDVLFRIDPKQFRIALDNAKAQLQQTTLSLDAMKQDYKRMQEDIQAQQAQVELDQANYDRYAVLVKSDSISKANYDQARFTLAADRKKLESLKQQAQVQLARLGGNPDENGAVGVALIVLFLGGIAAVLRRGWRLLTDDEKRHVVGPAAAGAVLIGQSTVDWIWLIPGLTAVGIFVDTYPSRVWSGTVESISPASGAEFSILPPQNASGNWVKVVQRISVRIRVDRKPDDPILRAGMSVTVDIDTGHRRSLSELF